MNKQEIAIELSKTYLENWLIRERNNNRKRYNLDETTGFFLSGYKRILKKLKESEIFDQPINPLAYSAALIYANDCIKENEYYDIDLYVREFILSYKYVSKEIKKDISLIGISEESNQSIAGYVKTKKNNNQSLFK